MALSFKTYFRASLEFDETVRTLVRRLNDHLSVIDHVDDLRDPEGRRVLVIVGISNPVTGGTLRSTFIQGLRYVTFLVRISALGDKETDVFVYAGGAESVLATDYGRNKGVVHSILSGLPGKQMPPPPPPEPAVPDEPEWRDSAPGL